MLLSYFSSNQALQGLANLQDFYLWVTLVGIPNAVVDNRRFLLHFYLRNIDASMNLKLRYDTSLGVGQSSLQQNYVPLNNLAQASPSYTIPNHSIFQSYETPDRLHFAQWLSTPIHLPANVAFPSQMYHQCSALNGFVNEDEAAVRQVERGALLNRTVNVCRLFWWLWCANRKLMG